MNDTPERIPDARYPGGYRPETLSEEWLVQKVLDVARKALAGGRVLDQTAQADLIFQIGTLEALCARFDDPLQDRESLRGMMVLGMQAAFIIGAHTQAQDLALVLDRQRQAAGGRKGGETRRAQAEVGWKAHATDLVCEIRAEDPTLATAAVSVEVVNRWKSSEAVCPTPRTVTKLVDFLEANGTVQPATKRK